MRYSASEIIYLMGDTDARSCATARMRHDMAYVSEVLENANYNIIKYITVHS